MAAYRGESDVAILLIERGADTEITNTDGYTPVIVASKSDRYNTISTLLQYGAEFSDMISVQKLLNAACENGDLDNVKIAHRKGASLNQVGRNGETPIFLASHNANYELVEYLSENGADASISIAKGHSLLHKPASDGEIEIVKTLLNRGADPSGGLQGALEFYYGDIVKLLIANQADANKVSVVFFHSFHV